MKKSNKLINETSPYLLQHAYNPVEWYPWGEEALARAESENKLIFLSIGYSSCHWCHVMEHESFEDRETAKLMNEKFINIKVDREERPDLDSIYMEAIQMMTGQGGWPLNVWLTPNKIPVFGGTYFPPRSMHGRPDFRTILNKLATLYEADPENVQQQADKMTQALQQDLYSRVESGTLNRELLDAGFKSYQTSYEPVHGGFSHAPKFPSSMGIEFLLRYYHISGDEEAKKMAQHSLEQMVMGGIYDQIGGGFHRYSTDDKWLVPHFEKMLYDNALLVSALCDAWQVTGENLYKDTIYETIGWLKREMLLDEGGFYSAQDADTDGEEGKYYVWELREINHLLDDEDLTIFKEVYSVTLEGNWEGKNILNLSEPLEKSAERLGISIDALNQSLQRSKSILLKKRQHRSRPGLDDKIITSWNAMMLKSLCKCYKAIGDDLFKELAVSNAELMITKLFKDDILFRTYSKGITKQHGFLDDYALLAEALSYVFEITGEEKYLDKALSLVNKLKTDFYDEEHHAFNYISESHEPLIANNRNIFDNATPSGNSAACMAFQRLGILTGDQEMLSIAYNAIERLGKVCLEHGTIFGYLLQGAVNMIKPGKEIVVVGSETESYRRTWAKSYDPLSVFIEGKDFQKSSYLTLKGKKVVDNKTTAYVCRNFECKNPVTQLETFKEVLGT
ncbi:MAG: thioredoxin domain-containing protein [Balneolales bacterium]